MNERRVLENDHKIIIENTVTQIMNKLQELENAEVLFPDRKNVARLRAIPWYELISSYVPDLVENDHFWDTVPEEKKDLKRGLLRDITNYNAQTI